MKKPIITMFDDIQRHAVGCLCGSCETLTGRSFGVSIRECEECCKPQSCSGESTEKAILNDDVIERVYAHCPATAREKAKLRALELGYTFLADI